jgi:hypothetical protein
MPVAGARFQCRFERPIEQCDNLLGSCLRRSLYDRGGGSGSENDRAQDEQRNETRPYPTRQRERLQQIHLLNRRRLLGGETSLVPFTAIAPEVLAYAIQVLDDIDARFSPIGQAGGGLVADP